MEQVGAAMSHRVVITGMGVVSPIGSSVKEFQDNVLAGVSGVGPISLFDPASLHTRIAAEVKTAMPGGFRDRKVTFACEAARQAFAQASACGSRPGNGEEGAHAGLSLGIGLEILAM